MSRVALVALARPTFDLAIAERNFQGARNLLAELGAEVVGPADLVMTQRMSQLLAICQKQIYTYY